MDTSTFLTRWSPRLLGLLRIVTGFLFAAHGSQKILHFPPLPPEYANLPKIAVVAGAIELVTGLLVLVGGLTRVAAFVASGEMAIAYFMAHAPKGFWPILNQGELAVLYCFIFLYLAAAGGGAWSVDGLRARR
jgi:putative oxidoreductase